MCVLPKGKTKPKEGKNMKNITKKELKKLAKEYGRDAAELEDYIIDMEGDGIFVDIQMVEDFLANGDF